MPYEQKNLFEAKVLTFPLLLLIQCGHIFHEPFHHVTPTDVHQPHGGASQSTSPIKHVATINLFFKKTWNHECQARFIWQYTSAYWRE